MNNDVYLDTALFHNPLNIDTSIYLFTPTDYVHEYVIDDSL